MVSVAIPMSVCLSRHVFFGRGFKYSLTVAGAFHFPQEQDELHLVRPFKDSSTPRGTSCMRHGEL